MEALISYFDFIYTPSGLIALVTLVVMEVVLGIDNLIFISILTNKLPKEQQARARRLGISAALDPSPCFVVHNFDHRPAHRTNIRSLRAWVFMARPYPYRRWSVSGVEGHEGNPPHG